MSRDRLVPNGVPGFETSTGSACEPPSAARMPTLGDLCAAVRAMGWEKNALAGPGPYSVEKLPGASAYIVVNPRGFNCLTNTKTPGRVATVFPEVAWAVAEVWNAEVSS